MVKKAVPLVNWEDHMRHFTRSLTAAVVGLVLSAPLAAAAPGGSDPVARQQRQLLHRIATAQDALLRAVKPSRTDKLTQLTGDSVEANAKADWQQLDDLGVRVRAADAGYDFRAAREEVDASRATNYVLVVNVLAKAERLLAKAPTGSAATAALTDVVSAGLSVRDETNKTVLRDLRKELKTAKNLLAPSAEG